MQSIKDVMNELDKEGQINIPKQLLEKTVYIMYKYYLDKEPEGEFISNYNKELGNTFELIKSSIYYIKFSFKLDVEITDNGDDTLLITKK